MIGDCVAASTSTNRVAMEVKLSIRILLFEVQRMTEAFPPLLHAPCSAKSMLVLVSGADVVPSVGAVAPGTPDVTATDLQGSAVGVDRSAVDGVIVVPVAALLT